LESLRSPVGIQDGKAGKSKIPLRPIPTMRVWMAVDTYLLLVIGE